MVLDTVVVSDVLCNEWRVRFLSCAEETKKLKEKKQKCQLCLTRFETIELPASTVFSVIIV